jgi:hypothetical protein
MSSAESHPEVLEALRLLHERVGRIEALHQKALQLPTSWNPFSGANKEELRRLDEMQARIDQLTRAGVLHDALYSNLLRLVNELQARAGLAPTPPMPYAPPPPPPPPRASRTSRTSRTSRRAIRSRQTSTSQPRSSSPPQQPACTR